MKRKFLIMLNKNLKEFIVLPIVDERPGGWYRPENSIWWYGPGSVIQVVEMDTDDHSSKGNPEFKPGDLVEVWDSYGLQAFKPRSHAAGEICMYVRTLKGRKEAEVMFNGEIKTVSRYSICPAPALE